MRIHRAKGTILGGVHLELTGEVNEEGFSVVSVMIPHPEGMLMTDGMYWRVDGA